ncbi:hypothetical protein NXC24_PA00198 (plasmid) [Rhizobium sp. NXC24]|nr:hypothetical protein NXC24_PA00198 [Rhizobium sp. NXC24]
MLSLGNGPRESDEARETAGAPAGQAPPEGLPLAPGAGICGRSELTSGPCPGSANRRKRC